MLLFIKTIDVLFELTFPIRCLVLVDDAFGREAVEFSLYVVQQLLSGVFLLHRLEPLDLRSDSALPGLVLFASLLVLPHSLLGRLVLGHGDWGVSEGRFVIETTTYTHSV